MDLLILDTNYTIQHDIDVYKSLIWTDRYNSYGDFELYIPMSLENLDKLQTDYYAQINTSDRTMILENIQITSSVEEGDFLTVTGRSLESILLRRIIWQQTTIGNGVYVQTAIRKLLNDAILSPSISKRKISNFVFKYSQDSRVSSLVTVGELQFTGDVLYDAIKKICDIYDLGFKITLNDSNQFEFELYMGYDRSYNQTTLPYIEFSPNFDNLVSSDYSVDVSEYKNVTLVAGEGEGIERKTEIVDDYNISGLDRYELYTDARDLSSNTDDGVLTDAQYKAILRNRGLTKLSETKIKTNFAAEVDYNQIYTYNKDYVIGDIVQFVNQYRIGSRARVTEFIQSDSTDSGIKQYPTFEVIEEE